MRVKCSWCFQTFQQRRKICCCWLFCCELSTTGCRHQKHKFPLQYQKLTQELANLYLSTSQGHCIDSPHQISNYQSNFFLGGNGLRYLWHLMPVDWRRPIEKAWPTSKTAFVVWVGYLRYSKFPNFESIVTLVSFACSTLPITCASIPKLSDIDITCWAIASSR